MLGDLVERLGELSPDQRDRVWELISTWKDTGPIDSQKATLRERIRLSALTRRRRHHKLDDGDRNCAEQAYALLAPRNPTGRHQWLFASQWVEESADELEDEDLDFQSREERISRQRRDALKEIWAESGPDGIKELCRSGDASTVIGWHIAEIQTRIERRVKFVQGMLAEQSIGLQDKYGKCVEGFLARLDLPARDAVLEGLFANSGFDEDGHIRLLVYAPFDSGTWKHVDRLPMPLKQRYWEVVTPRRGPHDASAFSTFVDELLKVNRPCAAFYVAHLDWERLDSLRLIRLLMEVATNGVEPSGLYRIDRYHVSKALDSLEQRGDTSRDELARLEFHFIEILDDTDHGIPNLEVQLSESPALFMQVLALAFKRNDGGEDPTEWQISDANNQDSIASAAYSLLTRAGRIPGTRADGRINLGELRTWLEQVRTLTREYGRIDIGDQMIGQLLSHCPPGEDGIWPCEPVREAIDDIKSQEIATGMSIGLRNARGATLRGKGGTQERELAGKYRNWSRELSFEHPFTAMLLEQIATSYDCEAIWWDNQENVLQRLEY